MALGRRDKSYMPTSSWIKRPNQNATGNMRVNVPKDVAEGLGMNKAITVGPKIGIPSAKEKQDIHNHNMAILSQLGNLDTYKKWAANTKAYLTNIRESVKPEQLKDIETLPWEHLVSVIISKSIRSSVLADRFMKEQAEFHNTAKGKGLTPKNSHYLVNQNWQTIAKQELTAIDVAAVIPETSPLIREELGITEVSNEDLPDPMENAEQVVKDTGMTNPEGLDTLIELQNSVPYLWVDETLDMATKMPLPEHTVDETLMPIPFMFFTFEKPVYFGDYMGRRYMTFLMLTLVTLPDGAYINWTCDSRDLNYFRDYVDREGICEGHSLEGYEEGHYEHCTYPPYRFLQPKAVGKDWIEYGWIKIGATYPMGDGHFEGDPKKKSMHDFISNGAIQLLNFLNTTAVKVERTGLSRSIRRDKSIDTNTREQEINVINLRREKYKGEYIPTGDGTGKTVDWKNEFWVTGHYRKQRYGLGRSKVKVIWIKTFMKAKGKGKAKKKLYKVVQ